MVYPEDRPRVPDPRRYNNFADWVRNFTERERGLQRALARAAGVEPQAVTKWLKGAVPKPEQLERIASWVGIDYSVLRVLADSPRLSDSPIDASGLREVSTSSGDVPLISWTTAGHWGDVEDPYAPGVAETWLPCPDRHSSRTFALEIQGVSMENPGGEDSFRDREIIYVDPLIQPEHGDYVVARLDDDGKATFKQLIIEGDRKVLKALNPAWNPRLIELDENASIIGVYIGKFVRSRRRSGR